MWCFLVIEHDLGLGVAAGMHPSLIRACHLIADAKHHWAIHREAPAFVEQSTNQEVLETGIKVHCHRGHTATRHGILAAVPLQNSGGAQRWATLQSLWQGYMAEIRDSGSYSWAECAGRGSAGAIPEGWEDWLVWWGWRGKDGADHGADQQRCKGSRWIFCFRRRRGTHPRGQ